MKILINVFFSISEGLNMKEVRIALASFQICFLYVVIIGAVIFFQQFDIRNEYKEVFLVLHCFYWQLYYINNLIYAIRVRAYRHAYIRLLTRCLPECCLKKLQKIYTCIQMKLNPCTKT